MSAPKIPVPDSFIATARGSHLVSRALVWNEAMAHLVLDEATALQLKGGRELLRAVADEVALNVMLRASTQFTYEAQKEIRAEIAKRFPAPTKRVRNEVKDPQGNRIWYDGGRWHAHTLLGSTGSTESASAACAAYLGRPYVDTLHAAVLALKDTPTIEVDASDPRPAVSE